MGTAGCSADSWFIRIFHSTLTHIWLHPAVTLFPLASLPLCFFIRGLSRQRLENWLKLSMNTEIQEFIIPPWFCRSLASCLVIQSAAGASLPARFVFASVSKSTRNKSAASVAPIQVSLAAPALQWSEVINVTNTGHIKAKYFFSLPPLIGTNDFTWLLLLFPPLPSPPRWAELVS